MSLLSIFPFGTGPTLAVLIIAFVVYYAAWIVYSRTLHPLASIPGPFWPSISRTWLMWRMHVGDLEIELAKIHKQHGPLVRIAPDEVSTGNPAEIPLIYRMQKPLEKTVWYLPWRAVPQFHERPDMFTTLLNKDHAAYKRIIAGTLTMGSVLRNEDQMDECAQLCINRMGEFADREESFDFGFWLEMYAFDIIGSVFFGKQFGFLENRHDHGKYIQSVHRASMLSQVKVSSFIWRHANLDGHSALKYPQVFRRSTLSEAVLSQRVSYLSKEAFGQGFYSRDAVSALSKTIADLVTLLTVPFLSVLTMTPTYMRMPVMACAIASPSLLKAVIAVDGIRKAAIVNTKAQMKVAAEATSKQHDILSQMLSIVHEKGEKVNFTEANVMAEMHVGIMAGADSTSILLRTIFYYMMKNPSIMARATAEVDEAFASEKLSWPPKHQEVVASLPYLCAVIREASRIFPSFAVQIQRYSPPEGITLGGKFIPPGYRVGMNPHIVHMDKGVFGQDVNVFRPERWLDSEEKVKAMDRAFIGWGVGTRPCAGKNLATAEINKIVPMILRNFTVEMAHNRPWKTHNASFIVQTDVICRLKRREHM